MKLISIVSVALCAIFFSTLCTSIHCQEPALTGETIALVPPALHGGKPLMQALNDRRSQRDFKTDALTDQQISNLLWAVAGINRPESGMRTAPTACNWQEIDVYVAMPAGAYKYEPKTHTLVQIVTDDIRAYTGKQGFVKDAPVVLIFVADYARMDMDLASKNFYAATDTGYMSQNAYLYCASEGLATVVLGWVEKEALKKILGLADNQYVMLTQPVGNQK